MNTQVRPRAQQGMGYLFMLFLVFLLSLGLGKTVEVYSTGAQREREAELVHVGELYRTAIKDFYLSAPDGLRKYPARLEDLLRDQRHAVARRYLRQLYPDPMTGEAFMVLPAPGGGVQGVSSRSEKKPLRTAQPDAGAPAEDAPRTYREWQFIYRSVD